MPPKKKPKLLSGQQKLCFSGPPEKDSSFEGRVIENATATCDENTRPTVSPAAAADQTLESNTASQSQNFSGHGFSVMKRNMCCIVCGMNNSTGELRR